MSMIDDRAAVKVTPEEEIALWKEKAQLWEKRFFEKGIEIRKELVSQLLAPSMVGGLQDTENLIALAEALAQYILNGKPAEPLQEVSDSPMVPLEDIRKFIQEKLPPLPLPIGMHASTPKIEARLEILTELARHFGITQKEESDK